ncbi:CCN family member 3-like [Hyperolius riggenbachi]|uniref:CCN family member 3-like n=1 Tax=Hyperolius riggenbachi TaxID=752182 RepID=UPI0035A2FC43
MGSYAALFLILLHVAVALGGRRGCTQVCTCPENPSCPLGPTLDTCGCGCTVCAQGINEECDGFRPCDEKRNLTCDFQLGAKKKQGVCKEREDDSEEATDPSPCNPATEWTPCSKTCGFGNSIRIVYEGESCTPVAERRLCMIRPCMRQYVSANYTVLKSNNVCTHTMRWSKPMHLHYRDCLSRRPLLPKFCGHCSDGRFCSPSLSDTHSVSFVCTHPPRKITRPVMRVRRCNCGGHRRKKGRKEQAEKDVELKEEDRNDIEEDV